MTTTFHPFFRPIVAVAILVTGIFASLFAFGEDADQAALVLALTKAKVSLADGLKQSSKGTEVPISAKFELDDKKQLSLSVYTAEKGLAVDAEHNVLKELAGSPEKTPWAPEAEVFKDIPHVARASEHLTVTSVSKLSLLDVVSKVQKAHPGTVLSITPTVHKGQPVFVVQVVNKGKVGEYNYDAITGNPSAMKK